jgi:Holliday junction DNA helicase RuvB
LGARVTAFYLADMADRGLHQRLGFASLDQFARQRMRMGASTFHEYVAVGRRLRECPYLDRLFADDSLRWSQVRSLVPIVTSETERAWGEWARGKTVKETRRQVARREKGDLPTDPDRRRIHTTTVAVKGRLNPVQHGVWSLAREALEGKQFGGPVADADLLMWVAHRVLRECADEPITLRPPRPDLDPLNQDPVCPQDERDVPTPAALRKQVLERDGARCACCGSKRNLSAHHMRWRRYGGRTVLENLVTLCEDCHSLVHDRYLILRGEVESLVFLDSEGQELSERLPIEPVRFDAGDAPDSARAESGVCRPVTFLDVPREVDAAWWRRHRHLFDWQERTGGLEFEPGHAASSDPDEAAQVRTRESASPGLPPARRLADLIGQTRVRDVLDVAIRSAVERGEPLGHVLLSGPPGLGKTSLARAAAAELGGDFQAVMAPTIRDPALLIRQLTSLRPGSVLFLDEIHRLPSRTAEVLYDAMESAQFDLPVRCGWEQRTLRVRLNPFTLIAATTEENLLPEPLRARFALRQRLEFYEQRELGLLLDESAKAQGLALAPAARVLLAGASRDTPREGLALLGAVRDEVAADGAAHGDSARVDPARVEQAHVEAALARLGTTADGVNAAEQDYLRVLQRAQRPLGLATLAARLGTSRPTVQEVYEPFLLRRGLVRTTPRGRCLARSSGSVARAA